MDLQALCEGSYEDALAAVEKRAEAVRTGQIKTAKGDEDLLTTLKGYGNRANNWLDQQIGHVARTDAAGRIGNWWRDVSADPAKLGLLGLGTGAGVGALASLRNPKGRRRPFSGAMLGGLLGGAALGGYGLLRHSQLGKKLPEEDLNAAKLREAQAEYERQTADLASSPRRVPQAVARDIGQAIKKLFSGDFQGAGDSALNAINRGDVLGIQEIFNDNPDADPYAPSQGLNYIAKATGDVADMMGLNGGKTIGEAVQLPNYGAAVEGLVGAGVADLALARRANSIYNPHFLRAGLNLPSGAGTNVLTQALGGDAALGQQAAAQLRTLRPGRSPIDPFGNNARTALGGRLPDRLVSTVTKGQQFGSGFTFTPTPAAPAAGAPAPTTPAPVHVPRDTLQSVSRLGRQSLIDDAPARGFLRSSFGSAQNGRLGGIGVPRGLAYPLIPAGIHWSTTRVNDHNKAIAAHEAAQKARRTAEARLDTHKAGKPLMAAVGGPAIGWVAGKPGG